MYNYVHVYVASLVNVVNQWRFYNYYVCIIGTTVYMYMYLYVQLQNVLCIIVVII